MLKENMGHQWKKNLIKEQINIKRARICNKKTKQRIRHTDVQKKNTDRFKKKNLEL